LRILQYSHKGHLFFYEPYGKQQLLPYTALTLWALYETQYVFSAVGHVSVNHVKVNFMLQSIK